MIQRIVNYAYRYPLSWLRLINRFGGIFNYWQMINSKKLMKKLSQQLEPVISYNNGFPIYFLTGKKYLYQTLFCISSLVKVSNEKFEFYLVDDGSFDKNLIKKIESQIAGCNIITKKEISFNIQQKIPIEKFPILNRKRNEYPHIKKLTDIHTLVGGNWKIVLDSDMLFWSNPAEMVEWLKHPKKPIHMIDCVEAYGYTREIMQTLCKSKIRSKINVGIIGLNSSTINWVYLENWIKELENEQGKSYFLEQALSAMLIGEMESVSLCPAAYIVNPEKDQVKNNEGTLHHYVDLSKEHYFKMAWKNIYNLND